MDNYLKSIFEIFSNTTKCSFDKIKRENSKDFIEEKYALTAAHLAENIYNHSYDYYKKKGIYTGSSREVDSVKYDLICDGKGNALLLIRGTSNLCNWMLNFNTGIFYLLNSLFSILFLYITTSKLLTLNLTFLKDDFEKIVTTGILSIFFLLIINYFKSWLFGKLKFQVKHDGFHESASKILQNINSNLENINKLIVIGHSMSGGVAEEILLQINNKIEVKNISFNTSISRLSLKDREVINKNSILLTYIFDPLTLINNILIVPFQKHNIEMKKFKIKSSVMKILLVINILNYIYIRKTDYVVSINNWEWFMGFYINTSLVLLIIWIVLIIQNLAKAIFVGNHLMLSIIEELDEY